MTAAPGLHQVPVDGGELAVEVHSGTTAPVLAIHGVSSQRRLWDWLRVAAPDLTLVAPDLRGRGDSVDVKGPSSIGQHADDMVAVLDALGIDSAVVCGMSMGGFVAVDLAHRYADRVRSLVLVDGGFPMAIPAGLTREAIPAVFADRLGRLQRSWPSPGEYLEFFVSNTAPLLDRNDPVLHGYLEHDLRDGQVRLSGDAFLSDAEDIFFGDNPWSSLTVPVHFVHAEWSVGAGSPPGYPPDLVETYRPHTASTVFVEGVDHGACIMSARGAEAAAPVIRTALA